MNNVGAVEIGTSFGIGFLTFISPCVLPIIPSYLAYITGTSFEDLTDKEKKDKLKFITLKHSIMFVLGFGLIFTLLGATATMIGSFLREHMAVINKIAGIIVFFFGLHLAGIIKLSFLMQEHRMEVKNKPAGYFGSFLVGLAFGAGWTPCVGPLLGTAFALASTHSTVLSGVLMLGAFSLGLGIPFILASLAFNTFLDYSKKFKRHLNIFTTIAGVFLMLIGVTLFFGWFGYISAWLTSLLQ
ncbi:MAG: cytochrome c biogenesis CcdA family protein [Vulcanimicrobiota bacterium]